MRRCCLSPVPPSPRQPCRAARRRHCWAGWPCCRVQPLPALGPGGPGGRRPERRQPGPGKPWYAAPSTEPPNYLEWAFDALGWGYSLIFLFLSFTLVALIVMNLLTARRENVCPIALVEGFEANVNERSCRRPTNWPRATNRSSARCSRPVWPSSPPATPQVIEAMQEVGEEENMKLEHRLSYMALIGTISPMIGLFGTVHGMINSFQVIATSSTAPKPAELAQGISTALFTTLIGLFIAIPAIAAYNMLRNRVSRLVLEVGILERQPDESTRTSGRQAILTARPWHARSELRCDFAVTSRRWPKAT